MNAKKLIVVIGVFKHISISHQPDGGFFFLQAALEPADHDTHLLGRDLHLNQGDRHVISEKLCVNASGDDQFASLKFKFLSQLSDRFGKGAFHAHDIQ